MPREQHTKGGICLYPVYFDASRGRAEGRRVRCEDAVQSPLASAIATACQSLSLLIKLEATKTHPADWANPGRVRVFLDSAAYNVNVPMVKNKQQLLARVSDYLKAHPTTERNVYDIRIEGVGDERDDSESEEAKKLFVPKGVKISPILPFYSPAYSGGGISDTFLQDMLKREKLEGLESKARSSGS